MRKKISGLVILLLLSSTAGIHSAAAEPSKTTSEKDKIIHLLNRITFGPSPEDITTVENMGIEQFINQQLHPESIPLPPSVEKVAKIEALSGLPAQLFLNYGPPAVNKFKNGSASPGASFGGAGQSGIGGETRLARANGRLGGDGADGSGRFGASGSTRGLAGGGRFVRTRGSGTMTDEPNASTMPLSDSVGAGGQMEMNQANVNQPGPAPARQPFNNQAAGTEGGNGKGKDGGQKILGQIHKKFYSELATARLTRSAYSPRQLEELMVDFWFNHFNVSFDKGLDHIWVGTYEEHAIRPHVLGKFRDLLGATAHHAAMSFYLDNWQNTAPDSPGARGKLQGLNENYARELLELHTLGVDGGYSQKDVVELARVLTGMGFQRNPRQLRGAKMMQSLSGTSFDASRHDFKDKVLLKKTIRGTGEGELEEALDLLASHPSTANHIANKLALYFVSDEPPPSLVRKLADKFTATQGDIRAVMSELLHSSEFWDGRYFNCKFKSPYKYMVSTIRGTETRVNTLMPLVNFLSMSGMPLYKCLTPDGYKCTKAAWMSPDALVKRIDLATSLGLGRFGGAELGYYDYRTALPLVGSNVSRKTADAIESAPQPLRLALILGSPEFMMY